MRGVLPKQILRRSKAPLAGHPWAALLPPARTFWWEEYLVASPQLAEFVDVEVAKATLARVAPETQVRKEHEDIDVLRLSLRPISLNLWLQQTASVKFDVQCFEHDAPDEIGKNETLNHNMRR